MYSKGDTICAISTPPGKGAIAVIRCSGDDTFAVCDKIISLPSGSNVSNLSANTIHFAIVHDQDEIIDQVVISVFRKPHSYSGEDILEISCHGSTYIQKK